MTEPSPNVPSTATSMWANRSHPGSPGRALFVAPTVCPFCCVASGSAGALGPIICFVTILTIFLIAALVRHESAALCVAADPLRTRR